MIFFRPKFIFRTGTFDECVEEMYNRYNSLSRYEIKAIKEFLDIDNFTDDSVLSAITKVSYTYNDSAKEQFGILESFFEDNLPYLEEVINNALKIERTGGITLTCSFSPSILSYISYYDKKISLSVQDSVEKNKSKVLLGLFELCVLVKINEMENRSINLEYDANNPYWIMVELVAKTILDTTKLADFDCGENYYYNLRIDNENLMTIFSKNFEEKDINSFLKWALNYVKKHIKVFRSIKKRV